MAMVTIRYWAAARAAAGRAEEQVRAGTLEEALGVITGRHSGGKLPDVLPTCSYLVDGTRASRAAAGQAPLADGAVIEVLPQFAGG